MQVCQDNDLKIKTNKTLKTLLPQIPRCWLKDVKNYFKCIGEFARNGNPQVAETKWDLQTEAVSWSLMATATPEPGAGFWYPTRGWARGLGPAGSGELQLRCLCEAGSLKACKGCTLTKRWPGKKSAPLREVTWNSVSNSEKTQFSMLCCQLWEEKQSNYNERQGQN